MFQENETICLEESSKPTKNWFVSEIALMMHEHADIQFVESLYRVLKNEAVQGDMSGDPDDTYENLVRSDCCKPGLNRLEIERL